MRSRERGLSHNEELCFSCNNASKIEVMMSCVCTIIREVRNISRILVENQNKGGGY